MRAHETSIQRQIETNNALAESFPAVMIEGHLLHVFQEGGDWHVWLNTEATEFDGLCIGVGKTRDEALRQAVSVCEAVEAELQKPYV